MRCNEKPFKHFEKKRHTNGVCVLSHFSHVWLFVIPRTVTTHQTLPSLEFPRREYWSGLPCPPPGGLMSPALAGRFFITSDTWEAHIRVVGFGFESDNAVCLLCTHFLGICYSGEIERWCHARGRIPHSQAELRRLPAHSLVLSTYRVSDYRQAIFSFYYLFPYKKDNKYST